MHHAVWPVGDGALHGTLLAMCADMQVAVIGAGPHGLSATHHLRVGGADAQLFGEPMAFWRTMPKGMTLRSNWSASNIASTTGPLSLNAYVAETGEGTEVPIPLDRFIRYGLWCQRNAVPDVDRRRVARLGRTRGGFALQLCDGSIVTAERVVVACGIADFEWLPPQFRDLPPELVSHTGRHNDMAEFAGKELAVVGGGQSALGAAALSLEGRASSVDVFVRAPQVIWLRPRAKSPINRLGALGPIVYAPTDVGPLWYSRLVATPDLFRRLPRQWQGRVEYRSIRAACSDQIRQRLDGVPVHLNSELTRVEECGGRVRLTLQDGRQRGFDHVLFGTGYKVDVAGYPFLSAEIVGALKRQQGYPVLIRGLESSVAGLHFAGAPAAWSFGPLVRFVSGSWYAGRAIAQAICDRRALARVSLA
jgi:cation diffusion facilitator CzcD-associated flavoprotein CzcO